MIRPLSLVACLFLAGCAGHVADHIGSRAGIVAPQLPRFGFDATETECVSGRLGDTLTPLQLRLFTRAAGAIEQGWFDPERLTLRDLLHIAGSMEAPEVRTELARALDACGVTAEVVARRSPVDLGIPLPERPSAPAAASLPSATAPSAPVVWLNLGAAPTGQSIAVEAGSVEGVGSSRRGWFRLTDPGAAAPLANAFRLEVDCGARTINSLAMRRHGETGAVVEQKEYGPGGEGAAPIEGGTVMEIAYLALCT